MCIRDRYIVNQRTRHGQQNSRNKIVYKWYTSSTLCGVSILLHTQNIKNVVQLHLFGKVLKNKYMTHNHVIDRWLNKWTTSAVFYFWMLTIFNITFNVHSLQLLTVYPQSVLSFMSSTSLLLFLILSGRHYNTLLDNLYCDIHRTCPLQGSFLQH